MFKLNLRKLSRKTFGACSMATPSRLKPRPTFRPRLEVLEDRRCPSTIWSPQLNGGVYSTDGNNAANYTNGLPSATNPLILDGSQVGHNQAITFSAPLDIDSLTVENNYNNTLTIKSGATLTTDTNDTVNTGCTLTLVSADSKGIELGSGNNFTVQSGATLKLADPSGATSGGTYLSAFANDAGEVLKNSGTVSWTGIAVASGNSAIKDTINAAVYNAGTFNADGGTKGNNTDVGGELDVTSWDSTTNSDGFDMVSGSVNLTNGATLDVGYNYYQAGGSLTSDSSAVTLYTGIPGSRAGDIAIDGGSVTVDTVANTVGTFYFSSSTVEINGQINVSGLTTGGNSTQSDRLSCGRAAVTLEAHSYLNVGTTGSGSLGKSNNWTVMTYGSYKNSWGGINVPAGMTAATTGLSVTVTGPPQM